MNFDISIIMGPLVGAVIGYCTNFIAVKMLFRPLKEIRIGKFKVPFTPGMIPKEKPRLAKKVGEAVGGTLLTQDVIEANLLNEEIKDKIKNEVNQYVENFRNSEEKIIDKLAVVASENAIEERVCDIENAITDKLYTKVTDMQLGRIVAEQVAVAVKGKLQGSFLAMMINDDLIDSFMEPVSSMVDGYIANNGRAVISEKVETEVRSFTEKPVGDLVRYVDVCGADYGELAVKVYETFVANKLSDVLSAVNINKIVEDKINDMDVLEAEELLLSVLKKELNAIVNLGAIIGFVLGIVMIFV